MPIVKQCKDGADSCEAKNKNYDYYTVTASNPDNTYVYHCSTDWNDCQYKKVSVVFPTSETLSDVQPLPGVSMDEFTMVIIAAWAMGRLVLLIRHALN